MWANTGKLAHIGAERKSEASQRPEEIDDDPQVKFDICW